MKLSHKLLTILLCFVCLSLAVNIMLARWSFEQGFYEFLKSQEHERLARLNEQLTWEYELNNEMWDGISISDLPTRHHRPPPPVRGAAPREPRGVRTTLVSLKGEYISGDHLTESDKDNIVFPVNYRGNTIAPLISFAPTDQPSLLVEGFLQRQRSSILLIGIVSLALSVILALVIVPKMLSPFHTIARSIKQLTHGQYHQYTQLNTNY